MHEFRAGLSIPEALGKLSIGGTSEPIVAAQAQTHTHMHHTHSHLVNSRYTHIYTSNHTYTPLRWAVTLPDLQYRVMD